ncbi:hypothetical protein BDR04DRAFT_1118543 [Suillus decipiens]|nr:hypothetical protein BDR04DRAFT_1118543 [Suillus decipiens]
MCRNVLKALRQSPVAQPPLPNLQRLDCSHFIREDYHLLDIFFMPSLTNLTIEVEPFKFPDVSFISPLAALCPHLTSFHLFGYEAHEPIMAIVSNIIMSLPHLQTLRCDQLSQAAIDFIAWHPSLTDLDINISSDHRYESLHILQLDLVASIDIDTIDPLLCFSKLRELHLFMGNPIHLSDEEFATMGASWPSLEVISFNDGYMLVQEEPPMTTLRGLIFLVNKCPLLRSAHLAININVLEGIEEHPTLMVGVNNLQDLVLADTPVENPRAVAFIISLAFPKVKEIVGDE